MNRDSYSFKYMEHIEEIFNRIKETQMTAIDEAAKKIAEAIAGGHAVYIFGASHAGILAQEMFYRTGGLAVINPILPAEYSQSRIQSRWKSVQSSAPSPEVACWSPQNHRSCQYTYRTLQTASSHWSVWK